MRMQNLRKGKTEKELENDREKAKIGLQKLREDKPEEEVEIEREEVKERMQKDRNNKSDEESEFSMISKMHTMRECRRKRTGKEHLEQNLKVKQGMGILEDEGPLRGFSRRFSGKGVELFEWEMYIRNNRKKYSILENKKPDIVQIINEKLMIKKEKKRKREKARQKDI